MQQTNQIYKYFLCNKKSYKCLKVQIKISGEKNQNQRKSKLITSKKQKKKRKENQRK